MKTTIQSVLIIFALVCFALVQNTKAVSPPPDGGYPGANTAEGTDALFSLTTGIANTAVGLNALHDNTTGTHNVAVGASALASNTTGSFNMAIGTDALRDNNANFNLAIGFRVGFMNTTGNHLTGIGAGALFSNTTGTFNTAIGSDALRENTTGDYNTAVGAGALNINATGSFNTATGISALAFNGTGDANTAAGSSALLLNTTGEFNTAIGDQALYSNRSGNDNTAIGSSAMLLSGGSKNIALGSLAGSNLTSGDNNIDIGNSGAGAESDTIRIGDSALQNRTFVAGISGATVTGTAVVVNGSGQLGVASSSARFKEAIKSMDNASEALFSLKPVTFRYKKDIDPKSTAQFGLVAEDVEKVNPDLVVRDANGKVFTVRYDAVNAMLLNEFLKEHRKNENLEATVAHQQKQIDALTAGLQKVSVQLESSKPAPQVVNNP